jgi:hypothetical protein
LRERDAAAAVGDCIQEHRHGSCAGGGGRRISNVSATRTRPPVQSAGLAVGARRTLAWVVLGVLPVAAFGAILVMGFRAGTGAWALDFNGNFTLPARDILRGVSPYDPVYLSHVRDAVAAGHTPDHFSKGVFVTYPAPTLLIGIPFTYLPHAVAEWLWVGLMVACAALALRLTGVRDWRVYGAALLTPALGYGLLYGAMDCLLMLALAAVWRWRGQARRGGLALGAAIALKLLFIPLVAWLIFTRRFTAAFIAVASAAALWLAGWALIGFHGFADYPHLVSLLSEIEKNQGYSSVAYAHALGLGDGVADAVPYVLGACITFVLWRVLRLGGPRADAHAFLLAIVAVLAFSPIVWQHYLTLLLVPLSVLRPRLSLAWLLPSLLWLTPFAAFDPGDALGQTVFAVAALGTIFLALGPRTVVSIAARVITARATSLRSPARPGI